MTRLRLVAIGAVLIAVLGVLVWFYQTGARSGADRIVAKDANAHAATVTEARDDERRATASTATIAARAARADDLTDRYVRQTIEDLRHAISDAPAAAGDTLPPADVDGVRNRLNAATDRANRAADPSGLAQ